MYVLWPAVAYFVKGKFAKIFLVRSTSDIVAGNLVSNLWPLSHLPCWIDVNDCVNLKVKKTNGKNYCQWKRIPFHLLYLAFNVYMRLSDKWID